MKKVFYLVFFLIFGLFGCEKYEEMSNPQLNLNGRWSVVDIDVVITNVNYESEVTVLDESKATVSTFYVDSVDSDGNLILTQDYDSVIIIRRFDESSTVWEFDYNTLLITDGVGSESMMITFPCTYCTEYTKIETDYGSDDESNKTIYTFYVDTYGAMPSNVLKLTSQSFYTDIPNQYGKAIESHLEITLHRF